MRVANKQFNEPSYKSVIGATPVAAERGAALICE